MFSAIGKIFSIIKNLPAIIALIEQVIALIKSITGDAGTDETTQVSMLKDKADKLEVKAGFRKRGERFLNDSKF